MKERKARGGGFVQGIRVDAWLYARGVASKHRLEPGACFPVVALPVQQTTGRELLVQILGDIAAWIAVHKDLAAPSELVHQI